MKSGHISDNYYLFKLEKMKNISIECHKKVLAIISLALLMSCEGTIVRDKKEASAQSEIPVETNYFYTTTQSTDKYWFYVRTSQGGFYDQKGFHYSQVLKCSQKVSTPGAFSKNDAVGPFDTFSEASVARRDEVELAERSGIKLIPRQAICDTRWH